MATLQETAGLVLDALRATSALGDDLHTCHAPTADVRALVAHVATVAPASLRNFTSAGREHNCFTAAVMIGTESICLKVMDPAPSCFRAADTTVLADIAGEVAAGAELLRLATPAKAPKRATYASHQPAPGVPVDGDAA